MVERAGGCAHAHLLPPPFDRLRELAKFGLSRPLLGQAARYGDISLVGGGRAQDHDAASAGNLAIRPQRRRYAAWTASPSCLGIMVRRLSCQKRQ